MVFSHTFLLRSVLQLYVCLKTFLTWGGTMLHINILPLIPAGASTLIPRIFNTNSQQTHYQMKSRVMGYKSFELWIISVTDCMFSFETQCIPPEIETENPKWKMILLIYKERNFSLHQWSNPHFPFLKINCVFYLLIHSVSKNATLLVRKQAQGICPLWWQ